MHGPCAEVPEVVEPRRKALENIAGQRCNFREGHKVALAFTGQTVDQAKRVVFAVITHVEARMQRHASCRQGELQRAVVARLGGLRRVAPLQARQPSHAGIHERKPFVLDCGHAEVERIIRTLPERVSERCQCCWRGEVLLRSPLDRAFREDAC